MAVLMFVPCLLLLVWTWRSNVSLGDLRIRRWPILALAAAMNFLLAVGAYPHAWPEATAVRAVVASSVVLVCAFSMANWAGVTLKKIGLAMAIAGSVANAVPQLVYGTMPYAASSAYRAGFPPAEVVSSTRHLVITDQPSWITALSDIIPVPWFIKVLSVGDVILMLGLTLFLWGLVRTTDHTQETNSRGKEVFDEEALG